MIFVFIGGASGSGKTSVSERLLVKLRERGITSQLLIMDDYIHEKPSAVDIEDYRLHTNFDRPSIMHFDLLREHIIDLSKGKAITKPKYSFLSCCYEGEDVIDGADVLIIEGIFAQYFAKTRRLPSEIDYLSVNVATESYSDIVFRRIERDLKERNRTRDAVIQQERRFVGPGFFNYTAHGASGSDVYIVNKNVPKEEKLKELDIAAEEIIDALDIKMKEVLKPFT